MRTGRPRSVSDEAIFQAVSRRRDRGRTARADARGDGRSGRAIGLRVDPAVRVEAEAAARPRGSGRHRDRGPFHPSPWQLTYGALGAASGAARADCRHRLTRRDRQQSRVAAPRPHRPRARRTRRETEPGPPTSHHTAPGGGDQPPARSIPPMPPSWPTPSTPSTTAPSSVGRSTARGVSPGGSPKRLDRVLAHHQPA